MARNTMEDLEDNIWYRPKYRNTVIQIVHYWRNIANSSVLLCIRITLSLKFWLKRSILWSRLKVEFLLVYFLAPHYNKDCSKTLQHWLWKSFFKGIKRPVRGMGREGKNWRGLEPEDDVITTCDKTHASQRYLQAAEDLVVVRDVLSWFSKIENLFFFRGSVRCQHE